MQRRIKKALSLLMAAFMVVGLIPNMPVAAAENEGTQTDVPAYVLDASTLSADDFGGYKTMITADMTLGTNGFFKLYAKGSKNSLADLSANPLTAENGTYTQAINLGGGLKNSGQAGIGFTLDKPAKLTAYVAVKAQNATKYHVQLCKDGSSPSTVFEMVNDTAVVNKIELDLEAGTYLLGGNNGGNFLYVEVAYKKPEYTISEATLSKDLFGSDNKLLVNSGVGTEGYFKVTTAGGKVKYQTGKSMSYNDVTYTTALRLDGGAKYNSGQATVEFTAANPVRVTMLAAKKGSKDSQLQFSPDNGTTVFNIGEELLTDGDAIVEYSIDLVEGTYRFGSTQGVDFYLFDVQEIGFYEIDGSFIPEEIPVNTKIEEDVKLGNNEFFTIAGKGGKTKVIDTPLTYDGVTYSKCINIGGGAKWTSGQATLSFTTEQTAKVTVYAAAKSDAASNLQYAYNGATAGTTIGALSYTDVQEFVIENAKPGTYMLGGTNGCNIAYIKVEYDPVDKVVTPWDEVPVPVIKDVTTDAEGNIVVSFDAVIDKYAGADSVTIVMSENGYEFATVKVAAQSTTSVSFTPIWSGDYTFKAIAQRNGEADKVSEEYTVAGYTLPVKKPIVELAQNRGNGTVYLDWLNVEYADVFNVAYKETGAADYTVFASETTKADATIEGLTAGKSYDFKIEAVRLSDNYTATYVLENFEVKAEAEQKWYFGTVGSAQETHATVANADGSVAQQVDMATKDETVNKVGITPAETDIVNTDKSVTFKATGNGKISDGEEGFQYFYTMINPNTDNFELTATFELVELYGNTFDNQTGYGIIATDLLGYNYYGTDGLWIKHKQLNSVSTQIYSSKANFVGQRNISGYTSVDATSVEGVTRVTEQTKFQNTAPKYDIGTTYTFTLKKTNDGYVSVCNGEEIKYDNLAITSVQEDGSVCIGVFASRNAGVKITDIKFSTSESTGVTSVEKDEAVTPSVAILSSGTSNTETYELIYHPNIAGKLIVNAPDGKVVYDGDVKAYDVIRVQVPVAVGMNEINSTLLPDASQKLTSYEAIKKTTKVEYQVLADVHQVLYVSPDGTAKGDGSRMNPYDLATVAKYAQPGQYIIMLNGTYTGSNITIGRSVSGTADKHITLVAEDAGKVILEGIGLTIVGSYWDIYGIYVHYPNSVGIQISGNYNTIEMCTVEGSANTGIQISRSGSVEREPGLANLLWPSYNLVKNCESFDNCDPGRNDADGFAAKLTCGDGNVFYGCIAHNNIDDGWDLFAKAITGEIGAVTIENSVAYNNGWLTWEDTKAEGYEYGEGNGFKLGGNDMYGGHVLKNSVSFGNIGKGITSNSCPDCKVYYSTAYGNAIGADSAYHISLATKASNHQRWVMEGVISMTTHATEADQIPFSLITENNYIFDGKTTHNSNAEQASDSWFESVDLSIVPTRNEDGTINMHGLLVPTAECPANAGARIDTTSAQAKSFAPINVNGLSYAPVFDAAYYAANNGDLAAVFGNNAANLFGHFMNYGIDEGRRASENFSVDIYINNYDDLRELYGTDKHAYVEHYIKSGQYEGRVAGKLTVFEGVDLSPVFDTDYYYENNGDLAEAFGRDEAKLLAHFLKYGVYEGRQASAEFNLAVYKNNYSDLKKEYGSDNMAYYVHYAKYGKAEGRNAVTLAEGMLDGFDYTPVFNAEYYASHNEDVAAVFGNDAAALLNHFINYGMSEGRQASEEFNVEIYRDNYGDLGERFKDDLASYYMHYLTDGKAEGRVANAQVVIPVENVTVYDGVDYAPVFNAEYYAEHNQDAVDTFGRDAKALLEHFVKYGMAEGRQGSEEFNVAVYKMNNEDIAAKFGDDMVGYYMHYITDGKAEGRVAK